MTASYLLAEIRQLAEFPGMNTAAVLDAAASAHGNVDQLQTIYDRLLEDCYGNDNY